MGVTRITRVVSLAFVLGLAGPPLSAQTGGLLFRVLDAKDKSPIRGGQVMLTSEIRAIAPTLLVTSAQGEALFPVLPLKGIYTVEVSFPGYERVRMSGLRVPVNQTLVVVFQLTTERQEVVVAQASRPTVTLEETATSTRFSDEFLQDLPILGRFYQNMLTFAPGVQDADGDGNPNVHGARDRDFKATIGGVSNQDPLTGHFLSQVNMDSVEEVEIVTAGAGVEYGRAQGGFANIIQKQGSNDHEGVASFFYRSDKLDGNGATNVPKSQLPEFGWLQPALHVSGPILRDRLWYRLSHEYISEDRPVDILGGLAVVTRRQQIHDDQLTWQVSPRNKLALQYRYDPIVLGNLGVSSVRPPESTVRSEVGGPAYAAIWTAPYSQNLLVESWLAYQDSRLSVLPSAEGVRNDCGADLPFLQGGQCFDEGTGRFSGSWPSTWHDRRQRFTARTSGTFYAGRRWGMTHVLKFGLQVENERYFRTIEQRPFIFFFSVRGLSFDALGKPTPVTLGLGLTTLSIPQTSRSRATGATWGLYAEDEIKPRSNLSVKLGVRMDKEYINSMGFLPFDPLAESRFYIENRSNTGDRLLDASLNRVLLQQVFTAYEGLQGQGSLAEQFSSLFGFPVNLAPEVVQSNFWRKTRRPGGIDLDNTNFSPRLAVSWDPWSDGRTKLALTAGRYYDKIFLAVPTLEIDPLTLTVLLAGVKRAGRWTFPPSTSPINPASSVRMVDRSLKTPYQDEVTFSFERELPVPETSIRLTYVRRRFRDQLQDVDINHLPADYGRCFFQADPRDPNILPSPGRGDTLTDPSTGEPYVDSNPGDGDGRLDDCGGRLEVAAVTPEKLIEGPSFVQRPDGTLDLYVQNPAWGSILLVRNVNTADYTAYVLELVRRSYKNWGIEGSYTYSRAIGDAEDFILAQGNDRSLLDDERGYLSFDVRHAVKVNAASRVPWLGGLRVGGAVSWQSGLPYSILRLGPSFSVIPPFYSSLGTPEPMSRTSYLTHRRNDQRNPSYWDLDVRVAKEINLAGGKNLQLTAEVFNLLNDGTLIVWNPLLRYGQQLNGRNDSYRRFGRQFQLGFRVAF